jgi:hypothetical protein
MHVRSKLDLLEWQSLEHYIVTSGGSDLVEEAECVVRCHSHIATLICTSALVAIQDSQCCK